MRRPDRAAAARWARLAGRAVTRGAGRLASAAEAGGRAAADSLRTSGSASAGREADPAGRASGSPHDTPADTVRPVTAARLLAAWSLTAPDDPSVAPLMAGAEGSPVHLVGSLPDFSFDVTGTASVVDARAIWTRTVEPALAPSLERAVNDWNRDHVWPTVWTERADGEEGAVSVLGAVRLECGNGASDAQLRTFLDVTLQAFATFFAALGEATNPGGSGGAEQHDTPEGPTG